MALTATLSALAGESPKPVSWLPFFPANNWQHSSHCPLAGFVREVPCRSDHLCRSARPKPPVRSNWLPWANRYTDWKSGYWTILDVPCLLATWGIWKYVVPMLHADITGNPLWTGAQQEISVSCMTVSFICRGAPKMFCSSMDETFFPMIWKQRCAMLRTGRPISWLWSVIRIRYAGPNRSWCSFATAAVMAIAHQ